MFASRKAQGLKTLAFDEFHRKTGKGVEKYNRYLKYLANHSNAAPHATPHGPPAAPGPQVDPGITGDSVTAALQPLTGQERAQAQHGVMEAFAPQLAQENASYGQQTGNLTRGLTQYAQGLAQFLGPLGQQEINLGKQTAGSLAAESAALQGLATGQGQRGEQYLANQLSAINAPSFQVAQDAGQRGRSIEAAIAAAANAAQEHATLKSGALGQLLALQPRLSAISGRNQLASGLSALAADHSKGAAEARSKMAAALQDAYAQAGSDKLQRGVAQATFLKTIADNQAAQASVGASVERAKITAVARIKSSAATAVARERAAAATAAAKASSAREVAEIRVKSNERIAEIRAEATRAAAAATAKARAAAKTDPSTKAMENAGKALTRILDKATAPGRKTVFRDQFNTGFPTATDVTVPRLPNYQRTLKLARTAVTPYLSQSMTAQQIDLWLHQQIDPLYPPGKFGRPAAKTARPKPPKGNPWEIPSLGFGGGGGRKASTAKADDPYGLTALLGG